MNQILKHSAGMPILMFRFDCRALAKLAQLQTRPLVLGS